MELGPVVAGAVAGLGAGTLTSVVAPWVQRAVERQRELTAHRRRLIGLWRDLISRHHEADPVEAGVIVEAAVVNDPDFLSLRAHLPKDLLWRLETDSGTPANPGEFREGALGLGVTPRLADLADTVDDLERRWKLV